MDEEKQRMIEELEKEFDKTPEEPVQDPSELPKSHKERQEHYQNAATPKDRTRAKKPSPGKHHKKNRKRKMARQSRKINRKK